MEEGSIASVSTLMLPDVRPVFFYTVFLYQPFMGN
jgi:hypothetical protein